MSYQRVLLHIHKNKIMEIAQMDLSLPAHSETFPIERERASGPCVLRTENTLSVVESWVTP
ncbi:hypothetical protein ABMD26_003685 [Pseudomonas sp. PvP001]